MKKKELATEKTDKNEINVYSVDGKIKKKYKTARVVQ